MPKFCSNLRTFSAVYQNHIMNSINDVWCRVVLKRSERDLAFVSVRWRLNFAIPKLMVKNEGYQSPTQEQHPNLGLFPLLFDLNACQILDRLADWFYLHPFHLFSCYVLEKQDVGTKRHQL